jgi:hypothetical protein
MSGTAGSDREAAPVGRVPVVEPDRRRSERLLLTIPIRVEGLDARGEKFSENTRTLVINRQGARIQLQHSVAPRTVLQITTLVGARHAAFQAVGPTEPLSGEGGEWGVECLEEKSNIWGIGFPPPRGAEGVCGALMECRQCHSVSLLHLSLIEHEVLTASGLLTRECKTCGRATCWGYTEKVVGMPVPGQETEPSIKEVLEPPRSAANRRDHARVALQLPIRVRNYYGVVEYARTENVSKSGLCFISDKDYEMGEVILVTCPYEKAGQNIEVRARVVRRRQMLGTDRRVYGVRYESSVQKH